jgi:hypothetical protein
MLPTVDRPIGTDRLVELKRTVESLKGQLREVQGELYRAKTEPTPIRLWRNLANLTGGREFMSAVCNRRARPNTRIPLHADSRL